MVLYQFINKCHFHADRRWKDSVPENIRFKKQYKPIGFGDRPSKDTVEGQRNAMAEAAETRLQPNDETVGGRESLKAWFVSKLMVF